MSEILSLPDLLRRRALENPDDPAFYTTTPDDNDPSAIQSLSYSQLLKATYAIAWHYASLDVSPRLYNPNDTGMPPERTVAIYFHTSMNLTLTEYALQLFGTASLLVSPNNSPAAVAHLLEKTNSSHVIVGCKLMTQAEQAIEILAAKGIKVTIISEYVLPLWGPDGIVNKDPEPFPMLLTPEQEHERSAIILHSSGSTGHPKPLWLTHRAVVATSAANFNLVGATLLPLFHGFGHHSMLRCIHPAQPLTVFPPHLPLTTSNIETVFKASEKASGTKLEQLYAVAYILKILADTPGGIDLLSQFKIVSFAGSAVPDETGDRLVKGGVNLVSLYGTTETGTVLTSRRDFETDKQWNWLKPNSNVVEFLSMEDRGGGTYEAVIKKGFPSLSASNRPDGSFATKDLFNAHPTEPNRYKYIGRLDDTLTHIVGEKTNPVPIELIVRSHPMISEAVVVGDGKPHAGAMIIRAEETDHLSREEFLDAVWPSIETANNNAPTHSRLLREMIEVMPADTDLPKATKGSVLRPACYAKFKDVIDNLYNRFESNQNSGPKATLGQNELQTYLKKAIIDTLNDRGPNLAPKEEEIQSDTDLFALGVSSLETMRIRTIIMRDIDVGDAELGLNVVYEHPTISKLAGHLISLRSGIADTDDASNTMLSLVDKYINMLPQPAVYTNGVNGMSNGYNDGLVVLLTGATGGLGTHLLDELIESFHISKVFTLVRAKNNEEALERLESSFESRYLEKIFQRKNGHKVHALAASLDDPELGLSKEEFLSVQNSVDVVIHNAWSVNFNIAVESFEAQHIRGAYNLINLCLNASSKKFNGPASFYFSSSVSTRQGQTIKIADENTTNDPQCAGPTGYARSKWVTEKICERAAAERNMRCGILRIGQMSGDSINGVWNETEAVPLLLRSVKVLGAFPELNDYPSYLPINLAASSIMEIVEQTKSIIPRGDCKVFHVVNPNTSTSWEKLTKYLGEAVKDIKFEQVKPKEWVKLLSQSSADPSVNPTYKLLDFYRKKYDRDDIPPSMSFDVTFTRTVSKTIKNCPEITQDQVSKWIDNWKRTGFF